ncbi:redoxin domain-containing protein [Mangrovibacterium sp.]|uniref:redoxin domain-containing protein n=1 Tax=Mangrovibacterium sp. TaxID=1961364 RepID=UPI0035621114
MSKTSLLIGVAILLLTIGCQQKAKNEGKTSVMNANEQENEMKEMTHEKGTLDSLLSERREESAKKFTKEKAEIYAEGIESVANSGILIQALNIGDQVPDFTLSNALNQSVTLFNELKNGPVILTWYRGGWCPYCNITLHYLQERLPDFNPHYALRY